MKSQGVNDRAKMRWCHNVVMVTINQSVNQGVSGRCGKATIEMLGRYAWALTPADFPQVRFDLNYSSSDLKHIYLLALKFELIYVILPDIEFYENAKTWVNRILIVSFFKTYSRFSLKNIVEGKA